MESSGEETPCLPEQLITEEILPRLPVKSLLKFRCVSKPWCSLIGSKRFIKAHLKNSIKTSTFAQHWIYLHPFENRLKQLPIPSLFDNPITVPIAHNVDMGIDFKGGIVARVGCCNGLVCILVNKRRFILWNPATKKFKNLPDFNNNMSRRMVFKYGFGFDELNDDYKVFGIVLKLGVNGNKVIGKVYSLRSNSWKDVEVRDVSPIVDNIDSYVCGKPGTYVCGKLHWYEGKCEIVSFDLNSHVYGVVELPSYTERNCYSLGVLGGCLSAHFVHRNGHLDVWVMKEYGVKESWNKMVTLDYAHTFNFLNPIAIAPNGEILLGYDPAMPIYNPNSRVTRKPHITGDDHSFACMKWMGIYIESLASLES